MDFENNFKQFLKESGCSEDNGSGMSEEELRQLQEAIKNSKDTANLENVQRQFSQETELIQEIEDPSPSSSPEKSVKEKNFTFRKRSRTASPVESSQKKGLEITYHDLPESSEQHLEIVHHKPVFDLPIATNPKYAHLSVRERAKLLGDYHSKLGALRTKLARKSLIRAPYPSPILPSVRCKNSLLKREGDNEIEAPGDAFDQLLSTQSFYTSRAGRQVKRKVYTEAAELDSDDDFDFNTVKKSKSFESDTKITLDNVYTPEQEEEKNISKNTKTKKDTPRRTPLSTKKGRSNIILDNSEKENNKMKQKQKEMSDFMKKLTPVDEDEEKMVIDDNFSEEDQQEFQEKIRISPPIRSRKNRGKKQQSQDEDLDRIDELPSSPTTSLVKKYVTKPPARRQKSKENLSSEEVPAMSACPICSREFSQSEIEDHAANCGVDIVDTFSADRPPEPEGKHKCGLCKKSFYDVELYLEHTRECMGSLVHNM